MSKENNKVMKQDRALCCLLMGSPLSRSWHSARLSEGNDGAATTSLGGFHGVPLGVVHSGRGLKFTIIPG